MILLFATLALADDEPAVEASETITGDAERPELGEVEERASEVDLVEAEGEWNARVVYGARALSLEEDFVGQVQRGCELIFERQYGTAKKHWKQMGKDWPDRGIEHAGHVLVYQALMMENFDFAWEKSYKKSNDAAMAELELAIRRELDYAERIALLKDDTARQVLGRRQLHRIRGQRIDGPDTFRSPMLSVAIARESLGEGEQTADAISGVQSIGVPGTAAPSALEPSRVVVREGQEYRILAPFQGSRGKERSRFALPTDGSSGAEFVDGGARQ